ncbi:MAG: sulfatase [Candidatus Omnitrophica bacterium]|nr:sulfatase [Candidatus Omnitrophota bacterium]
MNIIIIVSDTLRRDHLGCYGNGWISTPNIDKFSRISLTFENTYIGSFPTVPNRRDLFTGRFTFTYTDWSPLTAEEVVISEILEKQGYLSMFIADTPHTTAPGYNYQRGFSAWLKIRGQEGDPITTDPVDIKLPCAPHKLRNPERVKQMLRNNLLRKSEEDYFCAQTMRQACMWLEKNYREKFFLYVDTFDPHEPWDPPHYYVDMYDRNYDGEEVIYPVYGPCDYLTKREIKHIRAHYAGEVTLVDRWVGRLFQKIEDLDLLNNTIIVFTTDHGFYHGEHHLMGKSIITEKYQGLAPLYEEVTQIPLIMYIPKTKSRKIKGLVQIPDITATILDLVKAKHDVRMDGKSLLPLIEKNKKIRNFAVSAPSIIYGSTGGQKVTITTDDGWTLISGLKISETKEYITRIVDGQVRIQKPLSRNLEPELYYLPHDPSQNKNIFSKNKEKAKQIHAKFVEFLKDTKTDEKIVTMWSDFEI